MKVVVWGLGYTGLISAVCFAQVGHHVMGVEIDQQKRTSIQNGNCPIEEVGLNEVFHRVLETGFFRTASGDEPELYQANVSVICVNAPVLEDGQLDLSQVRNISISLGMALEKMQQKHTVFIRTTLPPHVVHETILPLLSHYSHKIVGQDFNVAMNPEFLREGAALEDFFNPPYIILGAVCNPHQVQEAARELYHTVNAPLHLVTPDEACLLKLANNTFHALKITFANEIGRISSQLNIDSLKIMDLICQDKKLNISPAYMKPGAPFGGSCLAKDIRILVQNTEKSYVRNPVIEHILDSNAEHLTFIFQKVKAQRKHRITIVGLSFKAGTKDLRQSQPLALAQLLIDEDYEIALYEPFLTEDESQKSFYESFVNTYPRLEKAIVKTWEDALVGCELVIISYWQEEFRRIFEDLAPNSLLFDMTGWNLQAAEHAQAKYSSVLQASSYS